MKSTDSDRRLGLALSGGGFRASFYHVGVLARMAEMGMLRHVESISTVSGGSIVGAAYYLLLKQLLESKPDADVSDRDYVDLVARLETHFLAAVQRNLRLRTFANPINNMRMALPDYSRSDAIGAIYERHIYRPLIEVGRRRIRMRDLKIQPAGVRAEFHPWDSRIGNPARQAKVPVLILNATSLNSGHNWVFTATSMGEVPPRNPNFRDIDKKDRYRRVRYDEIETREADFLLGNAVAASAGVPGLFPPMAVSGLYRDRRVQLVDGGVYDNQGIAGLLDPDCPCSDFVVSDASGQDEGADNPDTDALPVLINVAGIQGGRVREEMVNGLALTRPGRVAYFHLTRGLFAREVDFNEGEVAEAAPRDDIVSAEDEFEVTREAQRLLSRIRTDLDSFTEVEAGCLAADGYQMSAPRLALLPAYVAAEPVPGRWGFGRYLQVLKARNTRVMRQLEIGRHQFFKPLLYALRGAVDRDKAWRLALVSLPFVATIVALGVAIERALARWLGIDLWRILRDESSFEQFMGAIAPAIYALLVAFVLARLAEFAVRGGGPLSMGVRLALKGPLALIRGFFVRLLLPPIAALPVIVYLYTIDRYFVRVLGKLE